VKAVAFLQSVRLLNRQLSLLVSNDVAYWHFPDLDRCPSRGRKAHLGSAGGADTARPRTTITNSAAMSPEKLSQTTSYSPIQVCYILLKVGEHAGAVCVFGFRIQGKRDTLQPSKGVDCLCPAAK